MLLISKFMFSVKLRKPIPVAARSDGWVGGRSLAGISGSSECCVLSGSGLSAGLITRPDDSYRVCCGLVQS
jgi:hypothetical protein